MKLLLEAVVPGWRSWQSLVEICSCIAEPDEIFKQHRDCSSLNFRGYLMGFVRVAIWSILIRPILHVNFQAHSTRESCQTMIAITYLHLDHASNDDVDLNNCYLPSKVNYWRQQSMPWPINIIPNPINSATPPTNTQSNPPPFSELNRSQIPKPNPLNPNNVLTTVKWYHQGSSKD